jgi:MFS family permease
VTPQGPTLPDQPAGTLRSRTFLGLLIAQFLAAFNDQAIHASAMFFAIHTKALTDRDAISLMPILFYAPWALFCTLAGYLADRYSKRSSLVAWKWAEVGICLTALAGFWLGTRGSLVGPWVVLSTVFLMGTHSAFFVPAKYGAMPEILPTHLLSRGNGLLESLSFLAVILGTVSGGMLSFWFAGQEYVIGLILVALALAGAGASLLIRPIPAANPDRPFPVDLYGPLWDSLRALFRSKALAFAVIGIAFFTFVVAFMRATVYMLGESQNPRWNELQTSAVVGSVALGIGLGSPLAGWLSGKKVELGLVPVGALGMALASAGAALALALGSIPGLVASIVVIGFCTGFYIVPLFTLLQHRAPKKSKGDSIATSNFINVTGAIGASLLFFVVVSLAERSGLVPRVGVTDRVAAGELAELHYVHGKPTGFVIADEPGPAKRVGEEPPGEKPHPFAQPDPDHPSRSVMIRVARGVTARRGEEPGSPVVVSKHELRGVTHFLVRREGTPLPVAYDKQNLPEYLFLGAGLMTLLTLLVLRKEMPDLLERTRWFLRGLRRGRPELAGMDNVPHDGPAILAIRSQGPDALRSVTTAIDRYIWVLPPKPGEAELGEAGRRLSEGHLVGVTLDTDAGAERVRRLHALAPRAAVVPVHCDGFGSRNGHPGRVVFGPPLPDPEKLHEAVSAATPAPAAASPTAPAPARRAGPSPS